MTMQINNSSLLDNLLRQSLDAIARTEAAKAEATLNANAKRMAWIARLFLAKNTRRNADKN